MEILIIFVLVRVIGNAWDSKVDEYRAAQRNTRKQINQRYPNASRERRDQMVRNANRRKAAGYGLYQLRHGWPSLWTAIHDGWSDAREGHEAWAQRQEDAGRKPSFREAAREAWNGRNRKPAPVDEEPAPAPQAKPKAQPEPEWPAPNPQQKPQPVPASGGDAKVFPFKQPVPINTTPSGDTVEAPNLEAARQAAQAEATQLGARVGGWEQLIADLIAGGMGKDPQSMALAAQVQEHLATAQAAAQAFIASLGKHAGGEEYAATGHAAKTEFLQPS
jgi:hypothetical protein